ncbi:MAG: sulfite exporter TauE/SafE family protein, partial [Actinomycetota bacterium]|nr:sulfite exporter TauE/SafE family protein [Actinomycetota bacterium]
LWVAGIAHLIHGNVDLGAMAWLLLGSVPGILAGSQITVRLPDRSLRVGLATVLLASGVRLLETPGYDVWGPVILAAGTILAGVVELKRLTNGRVARSDLT